MLRKVLFVTFAVLAANLIYSQSGTLQGKVVDKTTGETIPFANVSIINDGAIVTGGVTDIDGKYVIKPIPAGTYTVKCSNMGYSPVQYNGVLIRAGKITFQDFTIGASAELLPTVEVKTYKVPLIDKEGGSSTTVTAEDIAKMPGRSATAVAATVGGVFSQDGAIGSIRGARSEGTEYYIDGVKVRGSTSLPKAAQGEVNVITGGVPASFGDVSGGIISITTKGPSRTLFGGIELVTSGFGDKGVRLDNYGYNLLGFSITGPMISVKDKSDTTGKTKKPIMGFFLSGDLGYIIDDDPSIIQLYQATEETRDYITNNPLRLSGTGFGTFQNADFLHAEDFEPIKSRQNAENYYANLAGKIQIQPSKNFDITIGASYNYINRMMYDWGGHLFNSDNNGHQQYNNWRTYIRLTQKFSNATQEEEKKSASTFKNAYYTIQADYSKEDQILEDDSHKDNLFRYGYVGKFTTHKIPSYQWMDTLSVAPAGAFVQNGFRDTLYDFEYSDINPSLSQYNEFYYNMYDNRAYYTNAFIVQQGGGLLNGIYPDAVYGMWTSPGIQYNSYSISDNSQFRVTASGSADVKDHEISIGFEFEQRNDRFYGVSPAGLWTLARGYANNHITELDLSNPILVYDSYGVFQDTICYNRLYNEQNQARFDEKLRESLGYNVDGLKWIDVDNLDPDQLKIDFFSADELFNQGYNQVAYSGYDAHGNRLKEIPSFEDFFTKTDEEGNYTREIAPFMPTYAAAYLQDKFAFKDLIFNIGLRVDRFDLNQMVLKDPYSLYETYTAGDIENVNPSLLSSYDIPGNIGDDFVVYVDNLNDPSSIVGYRSTSDDETTWYIADGSETNDPSVLNSSTGIAPYLVDPDEELNINGFKDYEPEIVVMPRISFSFPISEIALFFAHYDILSQRPYNGTRLDPLDYFYINQKNGGILSNPNAKPQKTIDYELGFQQKLSGSSSLKLSAFYREMRDMQQAIMLAGAYPVNYMTYGNIDFGTVKGFTATYDLRRTGNVSVRTAYTLQFASGTGSNANSGVNLIASGQPNLRTLIPLDFDQRHNLSLVLDYRFGGNATGSPYSGPKLGGKNFLQNTGVNFVINSGSGTPFSKQTNISPTAVGGGSSFLKGSINGSSLPWRTSINMRLDRDIVINFGKGDDSKKKTSMMNVYLDVQNLLNAKNIVGVYRATGNPDDDGYLESAQAQETIQTYNDPTSFVYYYQMAVNSPYNYMMPRRIRLGVQLSF
ncbi:MAG: hypothetical protein A2W91_02205 [Bacteroidetes bacterium GWF2_38_335]|nr:MAG: hypothetical protein A2W91_02205 [Bacteroidetes bacterium GWF2_38_335]OFY80665.1 MAG: hypothetical protein A2281_05220 [Bacteroidetes bacterium RIFOXYA12_FULL_38_20]HBS87007.1 hypothetical protein [Bacteroidales bacterium]